MKRTRMSTEAEATFTVIFRKLAESQDTDEAQESRTVAAEADGMEELRRLVEEATTPDCFEFATS